MSMNNKLEEEINVLKELFGKLTDVLIEVSNERNKVNMAVEKSSEQESEQIKTLNERIASLENKLSAVLSIVEEKKELKPVEVKPVEPVATPKQEEPAALAHEEESVELTEVKVEPEIPSEGVQPPVETEVHPEVVQEEKPQLAPEEESAIRNDIVKLNEELATIERNLSDIEFNYEGGFIDEAEYTEKTAQLQSKKDEIKEKIKELESKLS